VLLLGRTYECFLLGFKRVEGSLVGFTLLFPVHEHGLVHFLFESLVLLDEFVPSEVQKCKLVFAVGAVQTQTGEDLGVLAEAYASRHLYVALL